MKNTQPSRRASAPDLWRNAWVNGLAGLSLTLGLGMGLAGFLGLGEACRCTGPGRGWGRPTRSPWHAAS